MSTEQKIQSFANLPTGWHLGGGERPSAQIIAEAALYARLFNVLFKKTNAFPGANGEILLKAYHGDERVELTFEPDQTFILVYEVAGNDEFYRDGLSRSEMIVYLAAIIRTLKARAWRRTFGSSTPFTTTTLTTGSLQTWHSNLDQMARGNSPYLASLRNAPSELAGAFANTFSSTIEDLLPNQAYTGGLTNQIFQLEHA